MTRIKQAMSYISSITSWGFFFFYLFKQYPITNIWKALSLKVCMIESKSWNCWRRPPLSRGHLCGLMVTYSFSISEGWWFVPPIDKDKFWMYFINTPSPLSWTGRLFEIKVQGVGNSFSRVRGSFIVSQKRCIAWSCILNVGILIFIFWLICCQHQCVRTRDYWRVWDF